MKIIGFTGMPWSGKSEAVFLARKKNIPVFRMGDFVWNEVEKRKLPLNADSVGMIAQNMRKEHGDTIWAKKTVDAINQLKQVPFVVIDGIRSVEEVKYFRSHLSDSFYLVGIVAPTKLRHKRAKNRRRVDDSSDEEVLRKRDEREKKWGIDKVLDSADITVHNDSSLKAFHDEISKLFSSNWRL